MCEIKIDAGGKSIANVVNELFAALYGTSAPAIDELRLRNVGINGDDSLGPYFTGWKGSDQDGFCGQIVYMYPGRKNGVYVNLPGGESGPFARHETFNIGTQRIWTDLSLEESRVMLTDGLAKLKELMVNNAFS